MYHIFKSKDGAGRKVLITEIHHRDGNIIAALDIGVRRNRIEINDIRCLHPKKDEAIAHWINDGLLVGLDKHKGRE